MPYTDKIQYDRTGSASGTASVSPPIPVYKAPYLTTLTWGTNDVSVPAGGDETLGTKFRTTGMTQYIGYLTTIDDDVGNDEVAMEGFNTSASNENINMHAINGFTSARSLLAGAVLGDMCHIKKASFKFVSS